MATIQLGQEILAVEALIDERSHDPAFRQLVLLRDKFGRRPEFRYLQALFDATFEVRTDRELLRDMTALVAEQPDFTEAVSLLAFLYERAGDHAKAQVFAREALRAVNPRALARAKRVLGMEVPQPPTASAAQVPASPRVLPSTPPPALEPPAHRAFEPSALGEPSGLVFGESSEPKMQPVFAPQAKPSSPPAPYDRHVPRGLIPIEPEPTSQVETARYSPSEAATAPGRHLSPMPPPPDPFDLTFPPQGGGNVGQAAQPLETITFQPVGGLPPPPSIPPSAIIAPERPETPHEGQPVTRESPTLPGFARVRPEQLPREFSSRSPTPAATARSTPQPGFSALGLREPRLRNARSERPPPPALEPVEQLSPELSVDHTGPESRASTRSSRPAMAIPPPLEVQRHWFRYARQHQVATRPSESASDSTSLTLLGFAERVMEGRTPLTSDPVPLDRRGLIFVEQKLEQFRNNRGTVSAAERAATTSAAAFLLAVLMKEAEARAVDTTPEDGACKAVLPSGASVRPLLIAAAFARGRGPGLVESYDRAATAHMQRSPRATTGGQRFPSSEFETQTSHQQAQATPARTATRRAALSIPRRDLDPSTLGLVEPGAPMGSSPALHLRSMAEEFWASGSGREIAGNTQRVGTFTLADIDALERHATHAFSLVGLWPPGNPWPWVPSEEQQQQILLWGAILGEVLNGVYTGRWEIDPVDPHDKQLYRVVLAGTVVAWPMAKVYLRLARGVSHDLSVYVDVVGRIVARQASRLNV